MKKISKITAVILSLTMLLTAVPVAFAGNEVDYEITNPYETIDFATINRYKADLHSHTTFSDGNETLPAMVERHYEMGFDILAITDHGTVSYGYTSQTFNDPLKLISWVKNGGVFTDVLAENGKTSDGVDYRIDTDAETNDEYYIETVNGQDGHAMMRVPYGNEQNPTSFNNAHVNSWFADWGNGVLGGTSNYETPIAAIDEMGGLSVINHPGEYTNARDEETQESAYNLDDPVYNYKINKFINMLLSYDTCLGIDINSKGDSRTRYDRKLWDILLQKIVPYGRNVYAIATTDAHNLGIVDSGYTVMLMNDLTSADLKSAMENGQFFAASKYIGNTLEMEAYKAIAENINTTEAQQLVQMLDTALANGEKFYAGENAIVPVVTNIVVDESNDTITVATDNAVVIRWIADGKEIASGATIDLDDYADEIGSYVRAEIVGVGGVLYTQAFTLDYDGAPEPEDFGFFYDFGGIVSAICDTIVKLLPYILPLKLIYFIAGV
ncbi:MAG: PHP domain-containing protein [Clostridia bacterium]|nr:PHP domain-containing protein [Clostridia bacterium]